MNVARTDCRNALQLSIVIAGGQAPNEFCIFTAGEVVTTKGDFTFDEAAAASVMSEYKAHGIDLMIDYDHASLAQLTVDPALAGKAAGWFNIEVRDGALWAVNVRWTTPAAEALARKEWRFMSPAFSVDEGRITSLLNVAITNMPATRQLAPLMAASSQKKVQTMSQDLSPKLVSSALDAVASKDAKGALGVLQQILAALLGGSAPEADPEDAAPPAGDGGADEAAEGEPPVAAAAADPAKDEKEVAASVSKMIRLSGKASFVEAVAEIEVWRASHLELETERVKLAAERSTLEGAERRKIMIELVQLGAQFPATVWADPLAEGVKTLKARWLTTPIESLRSDLAEQRAARGKQPRQVTPPAGGGTADLGLSDREIAKCKAQKIDPVVYAKKKADIAARSNAPSAQEG